MQSVNYRVRQKTRFILKRHRFADFWSKYTLPTWREPELIRKFSQYEFIHMLLKLFKIKRKQAVTIK